MMRWIIGVLILIVGEVLVLQTPLQAQSDETHLPVSIDRIRAALKEQPPVLRVATPSSDAVPTFQVEVQQRLSIQLPVDEEPFDLTWGLPSAGQLAMIGVGKIYSAVVNYKHSRAERRARKEVEDALAAFCATRDCPATAAQK
jgi:hypothetical protein